MISMYNTLSQSKLISCDRFLYFSFPFLINWLIWLNFYNKVRDCERRMKTKCVFMFVCRHEPGRTNVLTSNLRIKTVLAHLTLTAPSHSTDNHYSSTQSQWVFWTFCQTHWWDTTEGTHSSVQLITYPALTHTFSQHFFSNTHSNSPSQCNWLDYQLLSQSDMGLIKRSSCWVRILPIKWATVVKAVPCGGHNRIYNQNVKQ